jgi:aspartyl-tRNA synthetase
MKMSGPIDKFIPENQRENLYKKTGLKPGSVLFFIADEAANAARFAGQIRTELAQKLNLIDEEKFEFCFVVDFPMYEVDEETGKIIFTHNPFSMPQGGLESLLNKDVLKILAYQYDVVCNGVELSSGAVRNHNPEIMVKAFEIAGYSEKDILEKFSALYNALKFGAPPHAGMAPGVDRMIMLLTNEENIRETIAFPMNSNAQDALLGAPSAVTEQQLRDVHIKIRDQVK